VPYAVTLTCDPLILNACDTSGVMCSNSVPNLNDIE